MDTLLISFNFLSRKDSLTLIDSMRIFSAAAKLPDSNRA